MKIINCALDDLTAISKRHNKLKEIFKTYQENLSDLQKEDTIPGFKITNEDTKSTISFIDREFVLIFSTVITGENRALNGRVSFLRNLGGNKTHLVTEINFNGNALVEASETEGEDPLYLDESSSGFILICNWLSSNIKDDHQPVIIPAQDR
jgi:hypothetical protein